MKKLHVFANLVTLSFILSATQAIADTTNGITNDVKDTVTSTGQAIQDAGNVAVDGVKTAVEATGEAIGQAGTATKDSAITAAVKAKLALESDIPSNRISVTTKNGIVYLKGVVDTRLQANKVVEVAASAPGVNDVDDSKLKVTSSDAFFKDAYTTAKVQGKILQLTNEQKIAPNASLHIETTNGVVHIFGTVTNASDVDTIRDAVSKINGVKDVQVNITTK